MSIQLITHETLEERRDKLKERSTSEYLEFKSIRYALFRLQTFINGGCAPETKHIELTKKYEEETKDLGGFKAFADLWDLDPLTRKVIKRDKSIWKAHEEFMEKAATESPVIKPTKKLYKKFKGKGNA